jgi:hypothetical protein
MEIIDDEQIFEDQSELETINIWQIIIFFISIVLFPITVNFIINTLGELVTDSLQKFLVIMTRKNIEVSEKNITQAILFIMIYLIIVYFRIFTSSKTDYKNYVLSQYLFHQSLKNELQLDQTSFYEECSDISRNDLNPYIYSINQYLQTKENNNENIEIKKIYHSTHKNKKDIEKRLKIFIPVIMSYFILLLYVIGLLGSLLYYMLFYNDSASVTLFFLLGGISGIGFMFRFEKMNYARNLHELKTKLSIIYHSLILFMIIIIVLLFNDVFSNLDFEFHLFAFVIVSLFFSLITIGIEILNFTVQQERDDQKFWKSFWCFYFESLLILLSTPLNLVHEVRTQIIKNQENYRWFEQANNFIIETELPNKNQIEQIENKINLIALIQKKHEIVLSEPDFPLSNTLKMTGLAAAFFTFIFPWGYDFLINIFG